MADHRLETKAQWSVSEDGEITGIAWPFGSPDRVGDEILKGAFAEAETPLPMLWAHDASDVIGVWESVTETDDGLMVKGRLFIDKVEKAREVHEFVRTGAVKGLSVGFFSIKAEPRKGGGRTISKVNLQEISLVTIPAHPGARVTGAKSGDRAVRIAELLNRATAHFSKDLSS